MTVLGSVSRVLGRNLGWKVAALFASTALWIGIYGSDPNADRYLRLQVSPFGLSPDLVVANEMGRTVEVQIRGPRSILRTIDEEAHRVALDLSGAPGGRMSIKIVPEMLNLPRRTRVLRIEPPRIDVRLEPLVRKTVPVRALLVPERRNGYRIANLEVAPASIEVAGPASRVERLRVVETEPINTLSVDGAVDRDVALAGAGQWLAYSPASVRIVFTVEEIEGRRTLGAIPVEVRNAEGTAVLKPATVTLTIRGPEVRLREAVLEYGTAFVDAKGLKPGAHAVSPTVSLPEGFVLEGVSPPLLQLRLQAPNPEPEPR